MRLAKLDGRIVASDTCLTEAWNRLMTERKVETRGLVENSQQHSFSNAWTRGLLSVRMHALLLDWMMEGLQCLVAVAIESASISQGSQETCYPLRNR